jgi:hypothetical protein
MGREKRKGRRMMHRAALFAAFCTLIAVTLLSALAPLGLPLSRATGSAFNPATIDVVLKVRAPAAVQAVQPARPDGDGIPPVALWCLFTALLMAVWRRLPDSISSTDAPRLKPLHLLRAHRARAPPAFF